MYTDLQSLLRLLLRRGNYRLGLIKAFKEIILHRTTIIALTSCIIFLLVSCAQPTSSASSSMLKISNNTAYAITVKFGNFATKTGNEAGTASIAPGASLDYAGCPVGSDFNIWYLYSDATTNWIVRLVDATSTSTYIFNFQSGIQYRIVLNSATFEYYSGATTIVGPGSGGTSTPITTTTTAPSGSVSTPVISVLDAASSTLTSGGSGISPFSVSMSCATSSTQIHYTIDGTQPTYVSPLYVGPFTVNTACIVNAVAFTSLSSQSAMASFTFSIKTTAAAPSISAVDGSSNPVYSGFVSWSAITVSMTTTTAGGVIRYTIDGTDPVATSKEYSGPFDLAASATVRAATFATGMNTSAVASASYSVYPPQVPGIGQVSGMARTSGSIVYAVDYTAAKLYRLDAATQTITVVATLPYANPTDIKYSVADDMLYIAYRYKGVLSRYSVSSASLLPEYTFSTTAGYTAAVGLQLSDTTNRIFVLVPDGTYSGRVAIVDKATGACLREPIVSFSDANIMALTPDGSKLFLAPSGLSAPAITAYSTANDTITSLTFPSALPYGSNGNMLAVSPDGSSLTYFCGGGNGSSGYLVNDYSPSTMTLNGAWNVGPYPTVGTFSPDSTMFYALRIDTSSNNGGVLRVFSRSTYQLVRDLPIPYFDDRYSRVESTADDAWVVVFTQDTIDASKYHFWFFSNVR